MAYFWLMGKLAIELGRLSLEKRRWPDNVLFLQAAYRAYLKREPDEMGCAYYLRELERKSLTYWGGLALYYSFQRI